MEKTPIWIIACSTGCSCCASENFYEGPFTSKDEATNRMNNYKQGIGNPLASQYAKYGSYRLIEEQAELLHKTIPAYYCRACARKINEQNALGVEFFGLSQLKRQAHANRQEL